jgi:hypothetical protein
MVVTMIKGSRGSPPGDGRHDHEDSGAEVLGDDEGAMKRHHEEELE